MKRLFTFLFLCLSFRLLEAQDQEVFDRYFENAVLRVDILHGVSAEQELIIADDLCREPFYAGSRIRLINDMNLGNYRYDVFDSASGKLIFSESYSNLFEEWQSTEEARAGGKKMFHESLRMPFPKQTIRLVLTARTKQGTSHSVYQTYIHPLSNRIRRESVRTNVRYKELQVRRAPAQAVDILFVAEGYTAAEEKSFFRDAQKLMNVFLNYEPYKTYADRFSFRAAFVASQESGTDEPDAGVYKNTAINSSFNTFGIARYLTTADNKTLRSVAAGAPYDQIVILTNSARYGGAGFYNLYSIFSARMNHLEDVFIHEFGHQFGALGDEYEGGFTDGYYSLSVEPWEPNLTIQTTREKIKWGSLIADDTPLPTPPTQQFRGVIGLFEGAGYVSKGIYRSQLYCIMRGFETKQYCAACKNHLTRVIRFYTED